MSGILSNITSNVQISGDMIYNQKKKKTNPFIKKKKKAIPKSTENTIRYILAKIHIFASS